MGIPVKISKLRPVALVASAALVVGTVGLVSTTSADAAVLTTVLGTVGITNGTDATHVRFADLSTLEATARSLGFVPTRSYSFPFPRVAGKVFPYNEFVVVAERRDLAADA